MVRRLSQKADKREKEFVSEKHGESIEGIFQGTEEVSPWQKQITMRAMVTSFVLSILFSFIVCKLSLTTGIIPSLNVAAGLLGFAMLKAWTELLRKLGVLKQPFTRQENTVIQTCVVASSGIAFSSMFLFLYFRDRIFFFTKFSIFKIIEYRKCCFIFL